MGRAFYYLFLYPLSLLPLPILYGLSRLIYFILYRIIAYRKAVVFRNIQNSFPDKSLKEREALAKAFYIHFSDIIVEGIKNLTISKKQLLKRFKIRNPELVEQFYKENKSVILTSGHFNNWEWLITIQNELLAHQAIGIGMPLSQKGLDTKINAQRERFGMIVVHSENYKEHIEGLKDKAFALLILADQSPGDPDKSYWTTFLNQSTGFIFGTEIIANSYDLPVLYYTVHKVKKGYYELEFRILAEKPKELKYGEITEKYVNFLEKDILKNPSQWIWSHKRWKKTVPEDIKTLKNEHEENFNTRFRRV